MVFGDLLQRSHNFYFIHFVDNSNNLKDLIFCIIWTWQCPSFMLRQWSSCLSDPVTLRHHVVTMKNGESLAKTIRRTINALSTFLVWIVLFHSTSCNAFVLGIQAFWSPKTPSKMILFTNNSPAITTSSFLQLPNSSPAIKTLSFLQLPNDGSAHFKQLPVLNDDSA